MESILRGDGLPQDDRRPSILIIEDDLDIGEMLVTELCDNGYEPIYARSVGEAYIKITNQRFDFILLDMLLENQSGEKIIQFCRTMKDGYNRQTPIVVMSGFLNEGLVGRIAHEVASIFVKPFQNRSLLDKLHEINAG